jgi:hypothetical protein
VPPRSRLEQSDTRSFWIETAAQSLSDYSKAPFFKGFVLSCDELETVDPSLSTSYHAAGANTQNLCENLFKDPANADGTPATKNRQYYFTVT